MTDLNRRRFLSGNFSGSAPIRPPWALPEAEFVQSCSRCAACVRACPEKIIQSGADSFPVVNFARAGCSFCQACLNACPDKALVANSIAWTHKAEISQKCLALNGVICQSCAEQCETLAIRFKPVVQSVSIPQINPELCTGCGACVSVCPVEALLMNNTK